MPEVLFVCVHNAGRTQTADALLDAKSNGGIHVRSAGSAPAGSINAVVVEALNEIGVDISKEFPKPMTDEGVRAADVIITIGCGDACPIYPGKRYEDWQVEDPAGKDLTTVRKIRDDIERRFAADSVGDAPPLRVVSGSNTMLGSAGEIVVDGGGTMFVASGGKNALVEFAAGVAGNAAPIGAIAGPSTQLNGPTGIGIH